MATDGNREQRLRSDSTREALWHSRLEWEARKRRALRRRPLDARTLVVLLRGGLRACGLWRRGLGNANAPIRVHEVFYFGNLPQAFDGFRILHVSDFHFSSRPGFLEAMRGVIQGLEVDLCVLTGDYPWRMDDDERPVREGLDAFREAIKTRHGIVAILGNNDSSALIRTFAERGIRVLVNEAVELHVGGQRIWIAGVDDPNDAHCDSLAEAIRDVPEDAFTVLLAHSPGIARDAARQGIDLYLCGHTHGGQVCLPCVGALFMNTRAPGRLCRGRWRVRGVQGYTTTGIGTTTVPVRFNCPPEAAIIELRLEPNKGQCRTLR